MAWVSSSGAKSSHEKPRYDLISRAFLRRLAERMGYGAAKHGERNYRLGIGDATYRRDRINHMIEHALKYAEGDTSTDHLSAIGANCSILTEIDEAVQPSVTNNEQPESVNTSRGDGEYVGAEPV